MIFFSDLDGTLLTTQKTISPATWRALDAIAEKGDQFVPCSGRALTGIAPELLAHPAVNYAIGVNGAVVYRVETSKPLRRICLGRERALELYEIASQFDTRFDVFADGTCFTSQISYDRLPEFIDDEFILANMQSMRNPLDKTIPEIIQRVGALERISIFWKNPAERDELWSRAEQVEHVSVVRSLPQNIEISDADGTKGKALAWLCDHLGIPIEESVSFGDDLNDVSMLQEAGTGAAMANAKPEALAAAKIIVPSNDEDGVASYIMECLNGSSRAQV